MGFPHYNQYDSSDCGPTCLRMIAKFYGKDIPLHLLRKNAVSQETESLSLILVRQQKA